MIPFWLDVRGTGMRGSDARSGSLFSYVDLESRVPAKHPLRVIKAIVDDVLVSLDAAFEALYEGTGRQSVAPERLLRASLLQAVYSVRSEERRAESREKFERIAAQFGMEDTLDVAELMYNDPDRADVADWLNRTGWTATAVTSRDEMRRLGRYVELADADDDAFATFVTAEKV